MQVDRTPEEVMESDFATEGARWKDQVQRIVGQREAAKNKKEWKNITH